MEKDNIFKTIFRRLKDEKPLRQAKSVSISDLMPKLSWAPKWTERAMIQELKKTYKRSVWVYACIKIRASNIATVPWFVERKVAGKWERDDNHELNMLLEKPCLDFSWKSIMRMAVYLLDLTGNNFMLKERTAANKVVGIFPLLPEEMDVRPGTYRTVYSYIYKKGTVRKEILAEDMVHLKYTSPDSLYWGLAPTEPAARPIDIDEEAEKYQKTSLQNNGVPPGVFTLTGEVDQEQFDLAKKFVKDQSGPENAGAAWVLGGGSWQDMGKTPKELDFNQSRKMVREEICAAYSVPPPLIGIYENATLANIETAKKILWQEGLLPVLDEIQEQLNLQLITEPGVRLNYDISNVTALQENYAEKITAAEGLWRMGVPLKDINTRLQLGLITDEMPGADVGYIQAGLLPANFDANNFDEGGNEPGKAAYGQ